MTTDIHRLVASIPLLIGGIVVSVSALAIALARILVDAGMGVGPDDAALLADIAQLLPFIIAFAVSNLVAAVGLLGGKAWAAGVALGSAVVAVTVGVIGLALVVIGRDPFAPGAAGSAADGIGILGSFTVAYLVVIVALLAARRPGRVTSGVAA
jgi:hypothetical protein